MAASACAIDTGCRLPHTTIVEPIAEPVAEPIAGSCGGPHGGAARGASGSAANQRAAKPPLPATRTETWIGRRAAAISSRSASVSASQTSTVPHRSPYAETGQRGDEIRRRAAPDAPRRQHPVEQVDDRRRTDRLVHIVGKRCLRHRVAVHQELAADDGPPERRVGGDVHDRHARRARAQCDQLGRDRPSERRVDLLVDPGRRREARVERESEAGPAVPARPPRLRVDHGDIAVCERSTRIEVHDDR